jgi:hypothetical protein
MCIVVGVMNPMKSKVIIVQIMSCCMKIEGLQRVDDVVSNSKEGVSSFVDGFVCVVSLIRPFYGHSSWKGRGVERKSERGYPVRRLVAVPRSNSRQSSFKIGRLKSHCKSMQIIILSEIVTRHPN